jgi:hypothetical protein
MLMIVSCQGSVIKIGYRCFNSSQKLDCQYQQFTGREVTTEKLQPGDHLEVSFEVNVMSGLLSIEVINPDETIL